jgi:hypothetical protein
MTLLATLLAAAPAVPYDKAGRYVAAGFIVFFAVVLVYVLIMATKLQRLEKGLEELNEQLDARDRAAGRGAAEAST